tara:strand:- start:199 stop:1110 length:912 start_codon:yes stop_codon:yes gene_type:complete
MFELFYHPIYTYGIDKNSTFPRDRYEMTKNYLDEQEIMINFQKPKLARFEDILLGHQEKFVTSFMNGLLTAKEKRRIGLQPWNEHIVNRTRYILGGSIGAMQSAIKRKSIAGNMAGGTHHAHFSYGSGYCIFNDLAICAIKSIKDYKDINNVLIIDLDVHQGDGTASILKNYKNIFTFSMHCENNFPLKKKKSDLDISLKKGMKDNQYLDILQKNIEILKKMKLDLILFQAGVDILCEDSLGYLEISRKGIKSRNKIVLEFAKEKNLPLIVFMGGGYSKPIKHSVDSFVDLFIQCSQYAKMVN